MPLPRWSAFVAPALLVLTALLQIPMARVGTLNPAKGGGFGLFSTVDKLENRIVLAYLETPAGDRPVAIAFDEGVQRVASFPTERGIERLARALSASGTPPPDATGLRLEVWKRAFDPATGLESRVLVVKRSVPFAR
jgi:hypothetical protein